MIEMENKNKNKNNENLVLEFFKIALIPHIIFYKMFKRKSQNTKKAIILTILCFFCTATFWGFLFNSENNKDYQILQDEITKYKITIEKKDKEIKLLKSKNSKNKPIKENPIKTPKKEAEKIAEKSNKTNKINKIKYDSSITYDMLARDPSKFNGKGVIFTGKIIQVIESEVGNTYRISINNNYNKIMLVNYYPEEKESRLLKNDNIRFEGVFLGLYTYETVLGSEETIPWVIIDKIINK